MSTTTTSMVVAVEANGALDNLNKVQAATAKTTSMFEKMSQAARQMNDCTAAFNNLNQKIQGFANGLNKAIQPGTALQASLEGLAKTSGVSVEKLKEIETYARKTAKTFGGTASDSAETYKEILAGLSPEIAKVPKALAAMGNQVATVSKLMGNDTSAATNLLTTAITQFGVSLDDPAKAAGTMGEMMNVMAAAAKQGSAGLPSIQAALAQAGAAATRSGVSFAETNAAIQMLDKAGHKGSEGGIALRNVMDSLSQASLLPDDMQANLSNAGVNIATLTDQSLSLSERMKPLCSVMGNSAVMAKIFGEENSGAATALLSNLDAMDSYTASIQGTNTATDQAGNVMWNYSEIVSRTKARVQDLQISLFNSISGIMPFVNGVVSAFQTASNIMTALNTVAAWSETSWAKAIKKRTTALYDGAKAIVSCFSGLGIYDAVTLAAVGVTYAFSYALKAVGKAIYSIPIIGWIAGAISLLIGVFMALWEKSEKFRQICFSVWETVKAVFTNIGIVIKSLWDNIYKPYILFWWDLAKWVANGIWTAMLWCWEGIVSIFSGASDFFAGIWGNIMEGVAGIGDFFAGIWNWLTESCSGVTNFISNAFTGIADSIKSLFAPVSDFVSNIFNAIIEKAGKVFSWIGKLWNKLFPKDQFKDLGEAAQTGAQKGSESWKASQEQKGQTSQLQQNVKTSGKSDSQADNDRKSNKTDNQRLPGKTTPQADQKTENEKIDLANIKGSTDYGAIVSKLSPVKINGLSANNNTGFAKQTAGTQAALGGQTTPGARPEDNKLLNPDKQEYNVPKTDMLQTIGFHVAQIAAGVTLLAGLAATTPNPAMGITPQARTEEAISLSGEPTAEGNTLGGMATSANPFPSSQPANFGKFCDQVVINVPAGTAQENVDYIIQELMKQLNGGANGF